MMMKGLDESRAARIFLYTHTLYTPFRDILFTCPMNRIFFFYLIVEDEDDRPLDPKMKLGIKIFELRQVKISLNLTLDSLSPSLEFSRIFQELLIDENEKYLVRRSKGDRLRSISDEKTHRTGISRAKKNQHKTDETRLQTTNSRV